MATGHGYHIHFDLGNYCKSVLKAKIKRMSHDKNTCTPQFMKYFAACTCTRVFHNVCHFEYHGDKVENILLCLSDAP